MITTHLSAILLSQPRGAVHAVAGAEIAEIAEIPDWPMARPCLNEAAIVGPAEIGVRPLLREIKCASSRG